MFIYLGEIVAHRVNNGLIKSFQLGGRLLRANIERQLLRAVQKQLDAPQS